MTLFVHGLQYLVCVCMPVCVYACVNVCTRACICVCAVGLVCVQQMSLFEMSLKCLHDRQLVFAYLPILRLTQLAPQYGLLWTFMTCDVRLCLFLPTAVFVGSNH